MTSSRRTAATALPGFLVAPGVAQPPAGAEPPAPPPLAAPASAPLAAEFNVRDYGAVGNG
ncbi:MAG TPA: hypothetical protein VFF37_07095 [Streptomyces sp.]|nr:hypothetical protein [Streptomyces sp.]